MLSFLRQRKALEELNKKYNSLLKEFTAYKKRYNYQNAGDNMPWRYDRLMAKLKHIKRDNKDKNELQIEIYRLQKLVESLTKENQCIKYKLQNGIRVKKYVISEYMVDDLEELSLNT